MKNFKVSRRGFNWFCILIAATLVVSGFFIFINKVQAATLDVCPDGCTYTSIQSAINVAAEEDDIINIASGSYTETLNLGGKSLTINGAGIGSTTIDASTLTGRAISNFGDSTTIRDLTLIGTPDNYGFKVSHVSDIILENIKVENSYKTGIDLNTVNDAVLNNIEVINTEWGFGLMMLDSNDISVTDISTSNNAWGGISVQTKNTISNSINFYGIFDVQENMPLLLEKDPDPDDGAYYDITDVQVPDKFNYVVYDFRESGDDYKQWYYFETLDDSKTMAQAFIDSASPVYSDLLIYNIAEDNYYVIEGILIQDAIDAVAEGGTVDVAAGTYAETVTLNKSLTLQGPNVGISPNTGLRVAEAIITGVSPLVQLPSGAVVNPLTIEGFTFQDATDGGGHAGVIRADGLVAGASEGWGNVTILSNRFINNHGPAVGVWATSGLADWTITDNLIDGVTGSSKSGIYLDLDYLDLGAGFSFTGWEVTNNTIKDTQYGGIMVHHSVDMLIAGNTIEDVQKTGIQSSGVQGNVTITGNVIIRAMLAQVSPIRAGIRLYGTDLADEYGESQLIGPVSVTNNIVTDSYIGFATKSGHDYTAHEVHVNGNSFTGNSEAGLRHNGTGLLDATNNYWGDEIGPGGEGPGEGDAITENVEYSPWYTNSEMTSLKAPTTTDPETGDTVLELTQSIDIIANDIIVSMPAEITITATASWEGIINTPSIETVALDTPTPESGYNTTVETVVEVGYSDIKLVFNKAVRILIPDQVGKQVGYVRPGEDFQEITNICLDDTQATNDLLPDEGDCKRNVGNDLAIWTKHFTQFIVYSFSPIIITPTFRAETPPEPEPEEEPSALSEEAQELDTNEDEKIDDLDLKELFTNWGSTILDNIADFNNDSKVDVFDFNLLMVHWTE